MRATSLRERDAAIESVHGFIWQIVHRHLRCYGGDPDDAFQECVALLCRIWTHYDAAKSSFMTWVKLTCTRHLRQSYALGRLNGPIVRVSYPAFKRGERAYVESLTVLSDGYGFDVPAREPKPEPPMLEDFVASAESLAGRSLSRDEQRVLVGLFVDGRTFKEIAKRHRHKNLYRSRRVFQTFAAEARRQRRNLGEPDCR